MPEIDFHPMPNLEEIAVSSLRANRVDPKLHYVTARQAQLWREVFLRHSPIHSNLEFARVYREAFAKVAQRIDSKEIALIGLGCGTGLKERELFNHLKARGREVHFSAIDVSRDLVEEAAGTLEAAGAKPSRNLVCDLGACDALAAWLDSHAGQSRRLFTFFGLVPNFSPSLVTRLFRAILGPGDMLLVSAHLAPIGEGIDLPAAMNLVLPQYDNPETLAWLAALLDDWEIDDRVDSPVVTIGSMEEIPAFLAQARWKSDRPFEHSGKRFTPDPGRPLQLFHSLRYTPALFEELLRREKFTAERLALTLCREEAIWSVALPG